MPRAFQYYIRREDSKIFVAVDHMHWRKFRSEDGEEVTAKWFGGTPSGGGESYISHDGKSTLDEHKQTTRSQLTLAAEFNEFGIKPWDDLSGVQFVDNEARDYYNQERAHYDPDTKLWTDVPCPT